MRRQVLAGRAAVAWLAGAVGCGRGVGCGAWHRALRHLSAGRGGVVKLGAGVDDLAVVGRGGEAGERNTFLSPPRPRRAAA